MTLKQPALIPGADEIADELAATSERWLAWTRENGADWGLAAAVTLGVFLLLRLIRSTLTRIVGNKKLPDTAVRNVVASVIRATGTLFLLLISAALVLPFFVDVTDGPRAAYQVAFMVVGTLQVAFWVRVIARAFVGRIAAKEGDEGTLANAMTLVTVFVNVIVFAVALVFILQNLGMDVTGLVAGLGVGGIAIGLAAQSLFEDLFAGLSIILDKPFVRGDFVTFGDKAGTVERVGLKSTRIRTLSGQQLTLNNSNLLGNEINNFRRMAERRIVSQVGVTYDTPHAKLERLAGQIRAIIEAEENVRFDRCHLAAFADFSINFEFVYYVLSREYGVFMDIQQRLLLNIHALFEREGIEFAFPTQTLHIGSMPREASAAA